MADRDLTAGIEAAELREGEMLAGRVGEDEVLLVRTARGVHAVGATCTHYGAPLADGIVVGDTVRCPWHHACFDLRSGVVLRAPALAALPSWRVEERDGRVFVRERIAAAPARATGPESVVIVGGGAAGVSVADTLRREGFGGRIVMITAENDLPYDRPNLSKDFLAGAAPAEWLPLHPAEYYAETAIELKRGAAVASIDIDARQIALSTGERLSWDALVLATGATPRALPVRGAERVRYLRSRADAERLVAESATARHAAIIGSSFIGLEVAASLRAKGLDVTIVAPDGTPLERVLGPEVGAHVRRVHEAHGVVFRLERSVASIDTSAIVLDDGSRVEADLVVAGIGVVPSLDLARAAGLDVANGVLVDEYLQTSVPGIFACGDIASWPDERSGERIRVEHWVVAGRQGQTVARNILGKRERFRAVPFFWSAHFDVVIGYVGHAAAWDSIAIDGSLEANDATIAYRRGGTVVAVATIGRDRVSLAAEAAMERNDGRAIEDLIGARALAG